MRLKMLVLTIIALFPILSYGQGCITIFSEDGDKFYLMLNGVKQNATPQANVRVDGLTNDNYSVKITFEDAAKPTITKTLMNTKDVSGNYQESTFKIKNKDGELKLRYVSVTPIPATYNPPPDMYYSHYGEPPVSQPATTVTQTTITTTQTSPNMGMNANVGGMNVNVTVPNSNMTTTTTQTTVTRETSTENNNYPTQERRREHEGCEYPMEWNNFRSAKEAVEQATFEDTKLSSAKTIVSSNCVSAEQVVALCKLFSFEKTKLDFAKFAYAKTTDKGNYFKVNNVFDFDASKTELNDFVSNGGS